MLVRPHMEYCAVFVPLPNNVHGNIGESWDESVIIRREVGEFGSVFIAVSKNER